MPSKKRDGSAEPAPPPKRRTALERLQLARRINAARIDGKPWDEIAAEEGIPKRTAQDILRKFQSHLAALQSPETALLETVHLSSAAIDVLCDEMENGDSSSARVGAARALIKAQHERLNLLTSIGWVPANVGAQQQYRDARVFREKVLRVLQRADIPDHVLQQLQYIDSEVPEDGLEDVTPAFAISRPKPRPW